MLPATAALTPGVPQSFTLVASANAKPGTATVSFLGQVNSVSGSADLSLTIASPANNGLDVPTWHYDMARTGLNSSETALTPANVNSTTFRKYGIVPTDGAIDAQPLYISGDDSGRDRRTTCSSWPRRMTRCTRGMHRAGRTCGRPPRWARTRQLRTTRVAVSCRRKWASRRRR